MRILFVESNVDGTVGGSHRAMHDLMTRLDPRVVKPVALYYQPNTWAERVAQQGIETHVWSDVRERQLRASERSLPARRWHDVRAIARRIAFLRRRSIDLVHLNNTPGSGYEDWLPAALLLRRPCITHARGDLSLPASRKARALVRRFSAVVAVSDHVAHGLIERGLPADRVRRVYDGIDCDDFARSCRRDPVETRAALGIRPDELLVLMVGHVRSWKGQHVVVQALPHLPAPILARTRCVFVGDTPADEAGYARSVHELAADLGVERAVMFAGQRDDVAEVMAAGDVVVHASTAPEPFGLVVLEALALGRPVIASRLGGPAEIVESGAGLLFDPTRPEELAHAIRRIVEEPGLAAAMSAAAHRRARDFDISHTVSAMMGLYRTLGGGSALAQEAVP